MGNPARILIGHDAGGERLARALAGPGYRCQTTDLDHDALAAEIGAHRPNLVILPGDGDTDLERIRRLKDVEATGVVPIAAVSAGKNADRLRACYDAGADDVFEADADEREIVARLRALVRTSVMESELVRRSATAREFGIPAEADLAVSADSRPRRLLAVGLDAAGLDALCPRLSRSDLTCLAEPDPYRARTRIEGEDGNLFDGALVYIGDDEVRERSLYFCHSVRNDRRMFDLPLFVAADPSAFSDAAEAYSEGASVFAPTPLDCEFLDVHLRLLLRGRELKRELGRRIAATLEPRSSDALGSVYSRDFLQSHLGRLIGDGIAQGTRSTAILFFIPTIGETAAVYGKDAADLLRQQMANWLSGLVRVEDMVGRAGSDEFLVLLAETSDRDAATVRQRVLGVLQESEFRLTDNVPVAVDVYIQSGMSTIEPDDTLESLIERTSAMLE